MEVYGAISRCLLTCDDFELIVYEVAAELARQNARYAELRLFTVSSYPGGRQARHLHEGSGKRTPPR